MKADRSKASRAPPVAKSRGKHINLCVPIALFEAMEERRKMDLVPGSRTHWILDAIKFRLSR